MAVLALAVAAPMAVAGTAVAQQSDNGKGDERPESAPGQVKQDGESAQPEARSNARSGGDPAANDKGQSRAQQRSSGRSQSRGKSQSAPRGKAKGHANKGTKAPQGKAKGKSKQNTHAKAGKTTICHATGSDTNPYVKITVSNNALPAHDRHQNDEDIIPAPAEGCPGGSASSADKGKGNGPDGKVTICHATGSDTNPYVVITISENALDAHRAHQNGEDIIPAPSDGNCANAAKAPEQPVVPTTPPNVEGPGITPAAQVVANTVAPAAAVGGAVLGESVTGTVPPVASERAAAVLGDNAAGTTRREAGASRPVAAGRLPFTGADLWILLAIGLGAILAGIALNRSLGNSRA